MSALIDLGAFSVSLAVSDLETSKAFYEKLGFHAEGGDGSTYLMMVNGTTILGLFQGLFEDNILTFNPGLGQDKERVPVFTDVRDLQRRLIEAGIEMATPTDPDASGPAHVAFEDPDGNAILIDQFFPRPGSSGERAP